MYPEVTLLSCSPLLVSDSNLSGKFQTWYSHLIWSQREELKIWILPIKCVPYHLPKVYVSWKIYRCILIFRPGFPPHRTAIYLGCTITYYFVYYLPLLEEEAPFSNLYMFLIERQSQVQWRTKGGMEWNRMIKPCFMHLFLQMVISCLQHHWLVVTYFYAVTIFYTLKMPKILKLRSCPWEIYSLGL